MPTDQEQNPTAVEPVEAPVKVKKPRKPRVKKPPKEKPVDRPVEISDDDPALQAEPDPRIDAVAAARKIVAEAEAPQNTQLRSPTLSWPEFEQKVHEARNQPKPEYVPPQPTARQAEKTRLEMEAGARRTAYFEEQQKGRPLPPPDPNEPVNTQVFRPKDFVPKHGSKDPAIASQNLK